MEKLRRKKKLKRSNQKIKRKIKKKKLFVGRKLGCLLYMILLGLTITLHVTWILIINSGNYFNQLHFRIKRMHELSINWLIKHRFKVGMHVSIDQLYSFDIFHCIVSIFKKVDSSFSKF